MSVARKLEFNRAIFDRANDILDMVWLLVEPSTARALTKSAWKARYRAAARDLATLKRTDEEITSAYHSACERKGVPVYSVAVIQDELLRLEARKPEDGTDYALYRGEA